ncbi:hypothetical protein LTR50_006049 [Elasticomyces elasticus]|nr:hypothetical protein LTR50_006049 [Elasticomyces elasticus]
MPTISLLNGHAFAGALMLAMMHDYRVMNPHRGYLCLNELELGVPLRPPMSSIFRQKVSPSTYRSMVLEARRYKGRVQPILMHFPVMIRDLVGVAKESYYNEMLYMLTAFKALDALKEGIIDSLGGLHETLQYIDEMQLTRKAEKGVYGVLKEEMWRETVGYLEKWIDEQGRDREAAKLRKQDLAEAERKVVAWERGAPKAKL